MILLSHKEPVLLSFAFFVIQMNQRKWDNFVFGILVLFSHSTDGSAMLSSALRLWAGEWRWAGLQGRRHHHPDQSNRWKLVRGHDQWPVGVFPHQLRGYSGAAPALISASCSILFPSRPVQTPGKQPVFAETTNHALVLLLLLCFCVILLSQKRTQTGVALDNTRLYRARRCRGGLWSDRRGKKDREKRKDDEVMVFRSVVLSLAALDTDEALQTWKQGTVFTYVRACL